MTRAEDLRALADVVELHDDLVAAYEAALDGYRADPNDTTRAAFKAAKAALVDNRQTSRLMEGRTGMAVGGDAFIVTPDTTPEG